MTDALPMVSAHTAVESNTAWIRRAAIRLYSGRILMTIHKSKGKEFDRVGLVEGRFSGAFFDTESEKPPFERSKRLLRVGITRARALVILIRPHDAMELTS